MDRPNLINTVWRKSSRSGEAQSSCVEVTVVWQPEMPTSFE
ncbi:DUF397 domain-containing protein [Actinoallomurus acanthiterrae]